MSAESIHNNKKKKKKDESKNIYLSLHDDIYKKLDHFHLIIREKEFKKDLKPPNAWHLSKKECPLFNEYGFNTGVGIITGQKIYDNKYIIGVDFDNKDTIEENNIIIKNGIDIRKDLYKLHKYKPNTVMQKTPTGGLHEIYYIDEETKNLINGHNKIMINNNKVHIDIKFENGFLLCDPSYYYVQSKKMSYKWINNNVDDIKPLPDFWIDILKNQHDAKIKKNKYVYINGENTEIKQMSEQEKIILNMCLSTITTKDIKENTKKWLQIGRIIKNEGGTVEMWDNWSKGVYNYDINCCVERWKYFDKYQDAKFKIHQLLNYYVKQESPDKYTELKKLVYGIDKWKNDIVKYIKDKNSIKKIYEDDISYNETTIKTQYLLNKEQNISKLIQNPLEDTEVFSNIIYNFLFEDKIKVLGIKSKYGSGKTKLLTKMIKTKNINRACFLSCRRALSYDIESEFNELKFKNYLDKTDVNYMCDKFIVQYESIHKIFSAYQNYYEYEYTDCKVKYDFVILDELETILNHTISPTHNDNNFINFKKLYTLCKNSQKVICLDGDLSARGKYFINTISEMYKIVDNVETTVKNYNVYECYENFVSMILNDVEKGLKLFFSCMTKKYAEDYEKKIKEKYPNTKTKIIHGDMNDEEKQLILKNVNEHFIKYDVLFITPAIDVGVNFDPKDKNGNSIIHFDKIYGIIGQSTCPRAFLQQLARVRHPKDNENYYILNSEFRYNETPDFFTFKDIQNDMNLWFKHNEYYRVDPVYIYYQNICIYNEVEKKNKHPFYFMAYLELLIKDKKCNFVYNKIEKGEKKKEISESTKIQEILTSEIELTKDELLKIIDDGKAEERHKRAYNKLRLQTNVCYFNTNEIDTINENLKNMKKEDIKKILTKKKKDVEQEENNNDYDEKMDITKKFIYQAKECISMNKPENLMFIIDRKNFLNKYNPDKKVYVKRNIETSNNIDKNIEIKAINELYEKIGVMNPAKEYELENFDEVIKKNKSIQIFSNVFMKDTKEDLFDRKDKMGKTTLKPVLGHINKKINKYSGYIKRIDKNTRIGKRVVTTSEYYYIPNKISIDMIKQRLRTLKYMFFDENTFLDHLKPNESNNFDIEYLGVDYDNILNIFDIEQS